MPEPVDGVLTTVAWDLGDRGGQRPSFMYALEGSVFVTGAAIQWLQRRARDHRRRPRRSVLSPSRSPTQRASFIVPAFTGLGSPWWDPYARGTILGLTRGVGRAHLARAVVESMAFQVRDVIDAMTTLRGSQSATVAAKPLRVDGGASVMDLLLQLLADQLQAPVARPVTTETTAFGAATLAGLAEGVWGSLDELSDLCGSSTPSSSPRSTRRQPTRSTLDVAQRSRTRERLGLTPDCADSRLLSRATDLPSDAASRRLRLHRLQGSIVAVSVPPTTSCRLA